MVEQDLSDILVSSDEIKEFTIKYKNKEYNFKMKELPWVKVTSIMSRCVSYDNKKLVIDKSEFDMSYLEAALVEAPWPLAQTRMYLRRLSKGFGNKLSAYLPDPMGDEDDELKKESV